MEFLAAILIDADYTDTTVQLLSLSSTYFVCVVTDEGAARVPQPLTLQITGYTTGGKQVVQECPLEGTEFNPALTLCAFSKTHCGSEIC